MLFLMLFSEEVLEISSIIVYIVQVFIGICMIFNLI